MTTTSTVTDVTEGSRNKNHLIWIDLEMTGLNLERDHIIEIATLITDSALQVVAEGPVLEIFQPAARLAEMDEWNTRQHTQSGLTARVLNTRRTAHEAEQQILDFLRRYVPAGASPMCGNSIWCDRRFLYKEMPELAEYFHYRNLDVSTVKILAQRWAPDMAKRFTKQSKHLALSDIYESIAELKFYRENFLKTEH